MKLFQTIKTEREGLEDSNHLNKKDLITRGISAIVLVVSALYLNYIGKYYFFSAVSLASIVLLFEYYRLFNAKTLNLKFLVNVLFGFASLIFVYFSFYNYFFYIILLGIIFSMYLEKKNFFFVLIPYFYFYVPLGALIYLNSFIDGKLIIYWIFIVVWTVDTSGYIFGKLLKGPKLIPSISPNKTWSGFIFGIFFSGIFSIFYSYGIEEHSNSLKYFLLGVLGGVFSTAGDLFESKLKRINKKKDASGLIPGHGGLLDRLDGFLFAILYFWLLSFI